MNTITHPNKNLLPAWVELIRNKSSTSEEKGSLDGDILSLIYQQDWFKILVPQIYGGLEMELPKVLQLEESLSWADGSLGWTVTLCAGAGWFGGFIELPMAEEIFNHNHVCLGGSGAPTGFAHISKEGYVVEGHWRFATGAAHLSHFTTNCVIKENNEVLYNEDGSPLIKSFVFNREDVKLLDDWKTLGLVATGSHAFSISNLSVSKSNSFIISPSTTVINRPLYQYPFLQLAETTLAANISGMAIHFLDLCEGVFNERIEKKHLSENQQNVLRSSLSKSKQELNEKRSVFYTAAQQSWESCNLTGRVIEEDLVRVSMASRALAKAARQCVDELYPYCGLIAADPSSEINRVWRDLHTASQHSLLNLA
jgi:alkylation response protein AidB-like acyl-CoA dehydrogenase